MRRLISFTPLFIINMFNFLWFIFTGNEADKLLAADRIITEWAED